MKPEYNLLLSLVRRAMGIEPISETQLSDAELSVLKIAVKLAKEQDVLPIIAVALENYTLPDEYQPIIQIVNKYKYAAVYRTTSIMAEQSAIAELLSDEGIEFILLKGAVIRNYYPSPWMRTSSDIDILLHSEDIEKVVSLLGEKLEYSFVCRSAHDVSVSSPSGVHVELHFALIETKRLDLATEILKNVWNYSESVENSTERVLSDDFFYYYHIAHMAKHFINGGCGMRTFIDLWLLDNLENADKEKRVSLLKQGGLDSFAREASYLSAVWLENLAHSEVSEKIEKYILPSGVYGVIDNMVAIGAERRGGKLGYILSRLFIPYSELKNRYPKMGRYKIFLPLLQIRRWLALLNPARGKRAKDELKSVGNAQSSELNEASELIKILKI